jgi:hypothetical protein
LQISALRFCSSFTTCAPTLPVPPVTKSCILEISCRAVYEPANAQPFFSCHLL